MPLSSRDWPRLFIALSCLLLVGSGQLAYAAGGFIAGTEIRHGSSIAEITIRLGCKFSYLSHDPISSGETLRIQLESTNFCTGISPLLAEQREQYRPVNADDANLVDIEYDGRTPIGQVLTLNFDDTVRYEVDHSDLDDTLVVRVYLEASITLKTSQDSNSSKRVSRLVGRSADPDSIYVINLKSFRKPIAQAAMAAVESASNQAIYEFEETIDGRPMYQMRVGFFSSNDDVEAALETYLDRYPDAWIVGASEDEAQSMVQNLQAVAAASPEATVGKVPLDPSGTANTTPDPLEEKVAQLMEDARVAMIAGEVSRAVQIYSKILQYAPNAFSADALEFLALAREQNGQLAHAAAEYNRYLESYPDGEGADRVSQRLAAMMAAAGMITRSPSFVAPRGSTSVASSNAWVINTYLSQYYRRDANQFNENDEVVNQSAVYSDINFDARKRGKRFDFGSRISAGYRYDALSGEMSSGNDLRVSYAYADLADQRTRLRGRIGRQSRHNGGVLGRFDGFNLSYQLAESVQLNSVIGKPVNSATDGVNDDRTFYGLSANLDSIWSDVELGTFFIQQDIDGMVDRQAIGAEMRYFSDGRSFWGLVDYDIKYEEIGSVFLQGSWRFESNLTLNAHIDRRRSPFLSTGNAMIGQQVDSFDELTQRFTEDELRQLSLDRSAISTTYSFGLSRPLSQRFQINADASHAIIEATPESGGVPATSKTNYRYYSTSLLASNIIKQGDVSVLSIRYSDSGNTRATSANIDMRFPLGRGLRINPRLRVEHREILSDGSTEWIYTPGIRMEYRIGQKARLNLDAGKQFASREGGVFNLDRETYFINAGYQVFFH